MALNLGDINFGLGVDSQGLDKSVQALIKFGDAVESAARRSGDAAQATAAAFRRQEAAALSALQKVLNMNQAIRLAGAGAPNTLLDQTAKAFSDFSAKMRSGEQDALSFQRAQAKMTAELGAARRALIDFKSAEDQVDQGTKMTVNQIMRLNEVLDSLTKKTTFADTQQGSSKILQMSASLNKMAQEAKATDAQLAKVKAGIASMTALPDTFANTQSGSAKIIQTAAAFDKMTAAASTSAAEIRKNWTEMQKLNTVFERTQGTAGKSPFFSQTSSGSGNIIAMQALIKAMQEAEEPASKFKVLLKDLSSAATLTAGPLSGLGARVTAFTSIITRSNLVLAGMVIGLAGVGFALFKLSEGAVETAIKLNVIEQRFAQLTGSGTEAQITLDHLREVADRSGTSFLVIADQFSKFSAAAQGSSLSGKQVADVFDQVVQAAGGMHLSTQNLEAVLLALEQMMSKGVISSEELRKQLGNALPGAFETAAKAMGKTTQELDRLLKAGAITSDEFLTKFAPALLKSFNIDPEKKVESLQSNLTRLSNKTVELFAAFDKASASSAVFSVSLKALIGLMDLLIAGMENLTAATLGFTTGMIAFIATSARGQAAILAIWGAIRNFSIGATLASLAAGGLAGVLARIAVVSIAAVAGFVLWKTATGEATDKTKELTDQIDDYLKARENLTKGNSNTPDTLMRQVSAQIEQTREAIRAQQDLAIATDQAMQQFKGLGEEGQALGMQLAGSPNEAAENVKILTGNLNELDKRYKLLREDLQKQVDTEGNLSKVESERVFKALQKAQEEIDANNKLGQAFQRSQLAGERAKKEIADTKDVQQFVNSLESAGLALESSELLNRLESFKKSLVQKTLGEIADKLYDVSRAAQQAGAVAATITQHGELGATFGEMLKQEQDIDNQNYALVKSFFALYGNMTQAQKAANTLTDALKLQLEAERNLEKINVSRELGRTLQEMAGASAAVSTGIVHISSVLSGLRQNFDLEDKIRQFSDQVARSGEKGASAAAKIEEYRQRLISIQESVQAEGLADVNLQIDRLNQELAMMPKGADAVEKLKEGFQIEDQVKAVVDQLVAMGVAIDTAQEAGNRLSEALHKVADANDKLDGTKELMRGLGQAASSAFDKLIDGGTSLGKIFGDLLLDVEKLVIKLTLINPFLNWLTGAQGKNALPVLDTSKLFGGGQTGAGALSWIFGGAQAKQDASGNWIPGRGGFPEMAGITEGDDVLKMGGIEAGNEMEAAIKRGSTFFNQGLLGVFSQAVSWIGNAIGSLFRGGSGGGEGIFGKVLGGISSLFGGGGGLSSAAASATDDFGNLVEAIAGKGMAWDHGAKYAANGMVLGGTTLFGGPNGPIIGGELGKDSEGLLPLRRGADGKLGVIAHGNDNHDWRRQGNGPSVVMNVYAQDAPSFGYSRAQILSQMNSGLSAVQRNN